MAGPQDWGAEPADTGKAAEGPLAWGAEPAVPPGREGGILQTIPEFAEQLKTPSERQGLLQRAVSAVQPLGQTANPFANIVYGMVAPFFQPFKKAVTEGLTPEEETSFGLNAALLELGVKRPFSKPAVETAHPVVQEFNDQVLAPTAQRVDSFARTGDSNGVRLEPPDKAVKPDILGATAGSPVASVPTSVAAQTGDPIVDMVINHPVTKAVIDNPIIDRAHDVPYMAGGSVPLNRPVTNIDRHLPKEFTVSRASDPTQAVTFDPARPAVVHENVEQTVIEILRRHGWSDDEAYPVAHFGWAEPAEHAWYRYHDIDPVAAEAEWNKHLSKIQHENPENPPPDLFTDPYPHRSVAGATHEAVTETPPTPDQMARAREIIKNEPELQPKSAVPMLQEARDLGVIGSQQPAPAESPAVAAQRAIPAAGPPQDKITMTPAGEPIGDWESRFKDWVSRIKEPDDVKPFIEQAAANNNNFPEARAGAVNPAHVEVVADAAGIDPAQIDATKLAAKFNNPDKIRMIKQALDTTLGDFKDAAAKVEADPSGANIAKMLEAEIRRDYVVEYALGLRAEWGRAGHALRDLLEPLEGESKVNDLLKSKGRTPEDMQDIARSLRGLSNEQAARILTDMRGKQQPWYYWYWQQGLISGEVTHSKYVVTNFGFNTLDRVIAPEVAAIIGRVHGGERVMFGEAPVAIWSMVRAVPDAVRGSIKAFQTGMRVPLPEEFQLAQRMLARGEKLPKDLSATQQVPYGNPGAPDYGIWQRVFNDKQLDTATKVIGFPGRSAAAIHTFYKILGTRASAEARAYRETAKEVSDPLSNDFNERYAYHRANPTDENLRGAATDGYSGTFMNKLGPLESRLASAIGQTKLRWLFPFMHIPINIAKQTIRYSPAAWLSKETRADLSGANGHVAQDLAISKMVIGSSVMGYFIHQALMGNATGDYPVDPHERNEWKMMGKVPNAIQYNGRWHDMTRLGPPGNLAMIGADIGSIIRHEIDAKDETVAEKMGNAIGHSMMAAVNVLGNEVGMLGIRNILDMFEGKQSMAEFAAYEASTFVPFSSFARQTASFMDPDMRQAKTLLDGLKMTIPGLRETVAPKRDPLYGEPVVNPGYHTVFRGVPVQADPVKNELDRLKYFPGPPAKQFGHVKLTTEQYDRYEATAGPLVKQLLAREINRPGYGRMSDADKIDHLKGLIEFGRGKARVAMQHFYPEIIQQGIEARRRVIQPAAAVPAP